MPELARRKNDVNESVSLVSFPRAAVAIRRLGFRSCPAIGTNQHPVVLGVIHHTVQRGAHHLTQRASLNSGSDGLRHNTTVPVCSDDDQSLGACDSNRDGRSLVSLRGSNLEYRVCSQPSAGLGRHCASARFRLSAAARIWRSNVGGGRKRSFRHRCGSRQLYT